MKPGFARKVLLGIVGIIAVLFVVHLAMQYLNLSHDQKHGQIFEISNRVDFDDEASLPTWFSQLLLLATGCSAFLAARLARSRGERRLWYWIGAIGILFSIDEVAGLHELMLQILHLVVFGEADPSATLNAWWLVLPFIGLAGLILAVGVVRLLPRRIALLLLAGGIVYVCGAVGLELLSNDIDPDSFRYQGLAVGLEEGFELLGTATVLYAVLTYLEKRYGQAMGQVLRTAGIKRRAS